MSKLFLVTFCALFITAGTAFCDDTTSPFVKPGNLYQVWFSQEFFNVHPSMSSNNQYVIKIDKINPANPNWVLVEYPQSANSSYNSSLAAKRWINLNYATELMLYVPPPQ